MDKLTDFFKAVSDETRIRILLLLFHKKLCVCQLCGIMGEPQPKVSKHLGKLRDLGFVKDERAEKFIYYSLKLESPVYTGIIQSIAENIHEYPIIKKDIEKVSTAESFLDSCKNNL